MMDSVEHIPEVAIRHSRLESSAYGRLALGSLDSAIADEELVRPAGIVLAEGAWDYREASTKTTPLYTDLHEPSFLYRAMLGNRRYSYIDHETEGQESAFGKNLYRAQVTLSNPHDMGHAVVDIVRNDWEDLDIQVRQADTRRGVAGVEPLRMDKEYARQLLSEFLHLGKEDTRMYTGLNSLEDVLTMMTHRAAATESTRSVKQETHRSQTGFTKAFIEETTAKTGNGRPNATYNLGVLSVFHIDKDPDISLATRLNFRTSSRNPRVEANVKTDLTLPEGEYMPPARREELLRDASRRYLNPDKFIATVSDQLSQMLASRKRR